MAQSGNTIALKSFQSFMVNDGLLSKTVEAIKAGEKEARSSGNVQSFEVFYKGFRQNIAIGRIYIVPPSVADKKGQDFPTALLYGCLVRTFGGEEIGDMISHKIGDTEWDEYSQASYASIKKELFGTDGDKFASLILFAPNWVNKREYVGFQFPKDDNELSNLTRHLVFSSYFDPRLSSAFDALMTDVETSKFDVTDITPKLNWPALAENPLKEFPLLTKEAGQKKARLNLTIKTADEVTKAVLEPQEMDVFDSLDTALRNSLMPSDTESVEDASEGKAPTKGEMVPRLAAVECDKCEGDGCKFCNNGVKKAEYQPKTGQPCTCKPGAQRDNCPQCEGTGQRIDFKAIREQNKKGSATAVFETPITNVGPGTEAHDEANQRTEGYKDEKDVPKPVINSAPIGIALDETGVPRRPEEERKGKSAAYGDKRDFPKIDIFVSGKYVASTTWASNIKEAIQKYEEKNPGPWAGEVKAQYDKRSSDKQAKRVEGLTCAGDVERLAAQIQAGDLSASASAALDGVRKGGKEAKEALEKHADKMMEYASSMSQDNQAHHAVADHQKEIQAGKYGPTPLSISSSKKGAEDDPEAISEHLKKNVSQARQGKDALKDHHASFDAAKWGGLGKKQASSLWVGTAKKVAAEFDEFTRGYIETALWSSNDESDESGGEPMDKNYDIRDLAPSCLQAMTEDCAQFQAENAELLAAASEQDGQDEFRQGHDFWLTRCGHGAGYWDGDYPTTGDGLTEASKAWGNVDIYVGDDDMIYQFGAEDAGGRDHGQKGPVQASKKASKKTASHTDASYIASLIGGGFGGEDYDARSQHSKTAAQKREEEMARKYSSQRKKFADVPQDIDDIWSETMEDMGPAPEIRLPGETKDNEKSTTGQHEIEAPEMSADSKSDVPEQVKGDQEEPTVKVEEALENDTTKSEEDKPSTGEGGASADSKETKSEKSEGGSKSEWAKNRSKGKSEKKEDEPKEEEPKEEEESKTAAPNARPRQRVRCDQCEMLSINGTATHETGCPNQNSRWDADRQDWVKQRRCAECGFDVDAAVKFKDLEEIVSHKITNCPSCGSAQGTWPPAFCPICQIAAEDCLTHFDDSGDVRPEFEEEMRAAEEAYAAEQAQADQGYAESIAEDSRLAEEFWNEEAKAQAEHEHRSSDISGDISEAKSGVESPDTVDTDIKQPTVSVPEAAKEAAAGMPAEVGEFPYVETLVGMGWSDDGEPGHFMLNDSRVEVLTFTDGYQVFVDGELYEEGDNVDELQNTLEIVAELGTDALNAHQAADDKTACAGYGDEEDEERHIDLGIGDLADVVVEKEDAN